MIILHYHKRLLKFVLKLDLLSSVEKHLTENHQIMVIYQSRYSLYILFKNTISKVDMAVN